MLDAYLYDGVRTPFGRRAGALAGLRPDDMLSIVLREIVNRTGIHPAALDDVIVGCANQAGEDSRCVARHAALLAGLPETVSGTVVQRNCGSGLGAVISAAQTITSGEASALLSGGVESMSRAPFVFGRSGEAYSRHLEVYDSAVGARFPNPRISADFGSDSMPQTADNLAKEFGISRERADAYALRSQHSYERARGAGFFENELIPVSVPTLRQKEQQLIDKDEPPRPEVDLESLASLRCLNPDGVTTAGNAAGINDGAVGLLLGDSSLGERIGVAPKARILASAVAGVAPRIMGFGPVPAVNLALKRAGLSLDAMDVIEINEAFSAQVIACLHGLALKENDPRVNPNGGAIAVGHPLGASGARLTLTAVRELQRVDGRYAVVSLCVGVGQGIALILEALDGEGQEKIRRK